jgi:hypothetical protein
MIKLSLIDAASRQVPFRQVVQTLPARLPMIVWPAASQFPTMSICLFNSSTPLSSVAVASWLKPAL